MQDFNQTRFNVLNLIFSSISPILISFAGRMRKIVTIIGARPQFIKAAAVSGMLSGRMEEIVVHTGQHYDPNMSGIFFGELDLPEPKYNLGIGSGSHGAQTGKMLESIEQILLSEQPDFVLVYGDTNSTLAGALAASKLLIPVIHIEAGLRSFNRAMPEEQNRILTDHLSTLLFSPTKTSVHNLEKEGITSGVQLVGDVMFDSVLRFAGIAKEKSTVLEKEQLTENAFVLCTIHRAENTNDVQKLAAIFAGLEQSGEQVVLPLHPRTRAYMEANSIRPGENIRLIEPVGYLDMLRLESSAKKIVTDSGGVQKEAFFLGKPCITLRDETEWVETVENGWNVLTGANPAKISEAIRAFQPCTERKPYFGDGNAARQIADIISSFQNNPT